MLLQKCKNRYPQTLNITTKSLNINKIILLSTKKSNIYGKTNFKHKRVS